MPYRLYPDGAVLRVDFDEIVTIEELSELGRALRHYESGLAVVPHRITDLSKTAGLDSRFADILNFVEQRKALTFANPFKSALVAPQPVHMGLARMFATLNDHPQITVRIFPDLAAAKAWIAGDLG